MDLSVLPGHLRLLAHPLSSMAPRMIPVGVMPATRDRQSTLGLVANAAEDWTAGSYLRKTRLSRSPRASGSRGLECQVQLLRTHQLVLCRHHPDSIMWHLHTTRVAPSRLPRQLAIRCILSMQCRLVDIPRVHLACVLLAPGRRRCARVVMTLGIEPFPGRSLLWCSMGLILAEILLQAPISCLQRRVRRHLPSPRSKPDRSHRTLNLPLRMTFQSHIRLGTSQRHSHFNQCPNGTMSLTAPTPDQARRRGPAHRLRTVPRERTLILSGAMNAWCRIYLLNSKPETPLPRRVRPQCHVGLTQYMTRSPQTKRIGTLRLPHPLWNIAMRKWRRRRRVGAAHHNIPK